MAIPDSYSCSYLYLSFILEFFPFTLEFLHQSAVLLLKLTRSAIKTNKGLRSRLFANPLAQLLVRI